MMTLPKCPVWRPLAISGLVSFDTWEKRTLFSSPSFLRGKKKLLANLLSFLQKKHLIKGWKKRPPFVAVV